MDKQNVKALAAANGITLSDARLELVSAEYQNLLRAVAALEALPLPPETEPANVLSLLSAPPLPDGRR